MQKTTKKSDYFVQSGLREVGLLRKHFNIQGHSDNVKVTGEVSPDNIKELL